MKKLLASLLALMLIIACAAPALAAEGGSGGSVTAKLLQFPKSGGYRKNRCGQLALGLQQRKQQYCDQFPPHLA